MNKIRTIMIGSACLILLLSVIISVQTTDYSDQIIDAFYLKGTAQGREVKLVPWLDETDGRYYLFLPSWFANQEIQLEICYPNYCGEVKIDGTSYDSGDVFREAGKEDIHSLKIQGLFESSCIEKEMQVLVSEELPSVFVTIEAKDEMLKVEEFENKQYLETGELEMFDRDGTLLCESDLERFKVRGNLTAMFDKKPFSFVLEQPQSLLGMEPAVKWNLLANATDGAYIRNKIIRDLAYESIDAYEPQGEFTELYLNGVYQGLYLLTEAVEIGENRIEISADDNWFVEMELDFRAREDATQIITDRGQIFIIHSEKGVSERDRKKVEDRLNDIESALFAEDGISTISGRSLEELIDLQSFAEAWLVEELSGDHDVGITSQFAYARKDEDSLWYSGPAWDFDGIMTNVNTPMYGVPESLTGTIAMTRPADNNNQNRWMSAMWNHPEFREKVKDAYRSVFRDNYLNILNDRIDKYISVIRRSSVLDTLRWHDKRMEWWFTKPAQLESPDAVDYRQYDTLDSHIAVIKDFMARKIVFLDELWIEECDFFVVEVRNPAEFLDQGYNQTLYYWVKQGSPITELPCYEEPGYRFEGYFDIETGEPVTDGTVIESDRVIEGVWIQEGIDE